VEILVTVKSKADQSVRTVRQPVNGRFVLGRGPDSSVPLEAPGISREHLEVQADDSSLFLIDLSSNGTWLNGARMPPRRRCRVTESDFIELPGFELHFQTAGGNATSAPAIQPGAAAARLPSPGPGKAKRSLATSFTPLEIFLVLVALASVSLFIFYLTA
jgi:predicted component of type VI protein secretion system